MEVALDQYFGIVIPVQTSVRRCNHPERRFSSAHERTSRQDKCTADEMCLTGKAATAHRPIRTALGDFIVWFGLSVGSGVHMTRYCQVSAIR